jgi:hypothetical protein
VEDEADEGAEGAGGRTADGDVGFHFGAGGRLAQSDDGAEEGDEDGGGGAEADDAGGNEVAEFVDEEKEGEATANFQPKARA